MAESVDALVSNTSGAIHPGSIPGLGTESGSREICFPISFYPSLLFVGWLIDRFSSYLVWVGVKFSNAKEEELLINDASQIGSKKFDFSIE